MDGNGPQFQEQINNMKNYIKNHAQDGQNPRFAAKCFIDSTSYKSYFVGPDIIQKFTAIKPYDQPNVNGKFRAASAYKYDFGNDFHTKESTGKQLINALVDQKDRAKRIRLNQRQGSLGGKKLPFKGQT